MWVTFMMRGIFDFIADNQEYKKVKKDWYVELIGSEGICVELILSSQKNALSLNLRKYFHDHLEQLNKTIKEEIDKRFVYFLGSRKKVRFSLKKGVYYSPLKDNFIFYLEIGNEKILKKVKINKFAFNDENSQIIKVNITPDGKYITFFFSKEKPNMCYIHDFLFIFGIQLGINTEIHYIGSTDNPEIRPFNLEHRGLSAMLHHYPSNEYDHFIFYNLFKVCSISKDKVQPFKFFIANSYMNEINKRDEGKIIELVFIYYFGTKIQAENKVKEHGELKNKLLKLLNENNIASVIINYEIKEMDECYHFYSCQIPPSKQHIFICTGNSSHLNIKNISEKELIKLFF